LSCPETKTWRMQFINKKWLCINDELAYKKIVNCTNKVHIIHLGEYLDKVKHKWESSERKKVIDNNIQLSLNVKQKCIDGRDSSPKNRS
jgi:hypothetical protein